MGICEAEAPISMYRFLRYYGTELESGPSLRIACGCAQGQDCGQATQVPHVRLHICGRLVSRKQCPRGFDECTL